MRQAAWVALLLCACSLLAPRSASGQAGPVHPPAPAVGYSPPPPTYWLPPPHAVPVAFVADDPTLRFTISGTERSPPFAYCTGGCGWLLDPGRYWLSIRSTRETVAGTRSVKIREGSTVRIRARERESSAALTLAGIGLMAAGIAMVVAAYETSDDEKQGGGALGGLMISSAGLVLLFVGSAKENKTEPALRIERSPTH